MIAIALALTLSLGPRSDPDPVTQLWGGPVGRLVTTPTLHVGVRPALLITPDEQAVGATIQVSVPVL